MDTIAQVIPECETCAAIKQAKRLKPLWYGGRWLKYKYGEAWQIDYITLPQTRQGKRYVLTMVEATTGWLETYPVPHATAWNTLLGLEKQVLWRHGTPERIESDNGTHFRNNLIDTWAKDHGIEWVYHIPYHAPASGKFERYNGLLKTTLRAMGGGTFKHWDTHLAKATWLVNTRGSVNRAGPAQSKLLRTVEGDKVPVVHIRNMLGKTVWVTPASGKGKPIRGIAFAQGPGCTWWVSIANELAHDDAALCTNFHHMGRVHLTSSGSLDNCLLFRSPETTSSMSNSLRYWIPLSMATGPVIPASEQPGSQAKQPRFPQPILIRLLLQTLHQLRCPLDMLQHLSVSLVVRGSKLNTVFEVQPHQCRVQGHDHFPSPAGHTIFDTSQDAIGFLGHLGTLLAHIQVAVNQHPQVLFCQAAFQPLFPKPVALHGVVVAQVQGLALSLVEPHTVGLHPSIQPVQVPL
ncbi:hypothetical protein QYF61_024333 [Mycteria americana]|uniref:Integrase catalytic domain-containing protein n=1 Tax=Mycteria americana TaxID=33587 RepID=A0AAN7RTH1_MYCAM|nr:hypothetical protein QYF61_024333 [Mycteria americana]